MSRPPLRLRLPATSANLGPGFDAVGLALSLWLTVEAEESDVFSLSASGRNADVCGNLAESLILSTYRDVLRSAGKTAPPLRVRLQNEIPLGMGCGSSAAALLAGVALANHFGELKLEGSALVAEASRLEGHPDNVAACWYGGFTVSAESAGEIVAATFPGDARWRILLAMQPAALATKKARALLPDSYPKADAVFNVQRSSLLVAAFAQKRLAWLRVAMQDKMHQPFRRVACPLLAALSPLAGRDGVAGVALSGAGPSVLLVLEEDAKEHDIRAHITQACSGAVEVLSLQIAGAAEYL